MKFDNDFNEVKIRHVIVIYLIAIIILFGITIFMIFNSDREISEGNMNILSLLAGILLSIMLIYKFKPSKENISLLYKDFTNKINKKEIIMIIFFLTCLSIGASKIIVNIIYAISPSLANKFINDNSITVNSATDYLVCFIILVILSPIVDELTFRSTLFKRLTKKFNIYVGLVVSSMIFSVINICPDMIGTLALGIINCILYLKYENILMPMFLYFINNIIVMLVLVPFGKLKHQTINFTCQNIMVNISMGIVLFIIGIIFMIKFIIKNKVYLRENPIKAAAINNKYIEENYNE